MDKKDFSIYFEPAATNTNKVDVALVSGLNSITQQIQHVARTQKNELIADMNFGSNFYDYIFTGNNNSTTGIMDISFAANIKSGVPRISNVKSQMIYYSPSLIKFDVYFSTLDGVQSQKNSYCSIEVPL